MSGESTANLPSVDFDDLLFRRRRFRSAKACYPCRRRKVKCDLNQPCGTCCSRGHPHLCEYRTTPAISVEEQEIPKNTTRERTVLPELAQGLYVDPIRPYSTRVHIGSDALPSIASLSEKIRNQEQQGEGNAQTIFELLCLQDSSLTFPFLNLWEPGDGPEAVYSVLPDDDTILSHFRLCQLSMLRIMPAIIDEDGFKATLTSFLKKRAEAPRDALSTPPLKCSPAWFSVLFGILACSVQLASSEVQQDLNKARVFACCAFQCLRLSNFLSYPDLETIQALTLIVNFLRNQADASASWSVLGLTIRLAQTLGLHCSPHPDTRDGAAENKEAVTKYFLWRSLMWQDTLVSLCYGRPSGITVFEPLPQIPSSHSGTTHLLPFTDGCHYLFITANKICQALTQAKSERSPLSLKTIHEFKATINQIEMRSVPHIQDISKCQQRDDYVEHYLFSVFADTVILCLCRPSTLSHDDEYSKELIYLYLSRCRSVLRTYLDLMKIQCPTRRSWVFVHVALSCALTLGMAADIRSAVADQALLKHFLETISQSTICAGVPAYENALKRLREFLGDLMPN